MYKIIASQAFQGLEDILDTLEELWVSYNTIEKFVGLEKAGVLRVHYFSSTHATFSH